MVELIYMKILITGAHFTPAVAVIEELKKWDGVDIVYVGRNRTMEGDKSQSVESSELPGMGVKFISIITGRLQRVFTIYTIPSLLKLPIGFIQALYIILSEKPDIILSFGGYVAVPLVIMGWLWSIPIIIHEQTLVSGLANKICALFADKICLGFSENDFSKKDNAVITGNPIRSEILHPEGNLDSSYGKLLKAAQNGKIPVVLITGGNQGSHVLNLAVEAVLEKLTRIACVMHVSGENKFGDFERLEKIQNNHYLVEKWVGKEWGLLLSKIDLVVTRGGINSLSEIAVLGKPALIVPIPYLTQNEQGRNAEYFEKLGLAKVLPQSKLSGESLLRNIKDMLNNLDDLKDKAKNAGNEIAPDGAKRLVLETFLLKKMIP